MGIFFCIGLNLFNIYFISVQSFASPEERDRFARSIVQAQSVCVL